MSRWAATALVVALAAAACHRRVSPSTPVPPPVQASVPIEALWRAPEPNRDLFAGIGGAQEAPAAHSRFTLLRGKGHGPGESFDVADPRQRQWSVTPSPEAQPEVTASRLLWGVGYHQLPVYVLAGWRADGAATPNPQPTALFQPKRVTVAGQAMSEHGSWSYSHGPFSGSRELGGLIALQVMLGSAELNDGRNRIFELDEPLEGSRAWYVAGGLGGAFGRAGLPRASRADIEAFETSRLIASVSHGVVQFDLPAPHSPLADRLTPADIHWICTRLQGLTDRQWRDAFRAGGFQPAVSARLIRRMKAKVAEGLALPG
jgi:hypothetical protein